MSGRFILQGEMCRNSLLQMGRYMVSGSEKQEPHDGSHMYVAEVTADHHVRKAWELERHFRKPPRSWRGIVKVSKHMAHIRIVVKRKEQGDVTRSCCYDIVAQFLRLLSQSRVAQDYDQDGIPLLSPPSPCIFFTLLLLQIHRYLVLYIATARIHGRRQVGALPISSR
jgi:hypothetical protein